MELINKYFPGLDEGKKGQLQALADAWREWNDKINVISRRDIDAIEEHHILHSLAIARFMTPADGTCIMDLGCGGGLPGLPLAVVWPQCRFLLVDRVGKKIRVAQEAAKAAGLTNVDFKHGDSGEVHDKFDYIVSRAVMPLDGLVKAVRGNVGRHIANAFPPGLVCLKGGDLSSELSAVKRPKIEVPLTDYFQGEYFNEKYLIYVEL